MSAHLKEQLLRFVRVSWWAFVVSVVATGGRVSWASAAAMAVGALETGYRQVVQVAPVPLVTSEAAPEEKGSP